MTAIGIDLGTTNSVASFFDGRKVKILRNRANNALTPSVVGYRKPKRGKEGEILVGQNAVNNAGLNPENTVFSIKRLMGRYCNDPKIKEMKDRLSYKVITDPKDKDDQRARVLINEEEYLPSDVSAFILKEIKEYAEFRLDLPVSHAVITVPAYFEERQRAATREAGEKAGLIVKMIMSEPVAAAIAFGFDSVKDVGKRVVVFDFGGGTFDISIIQMVEENFQVLYHGGNNWLGGDDFDKEIINYIIQNVKEEYGHDPSTDPIFLARAKDHAQKAKIALSSSEEVEIIINPAGSLPGGESFSVDLSLSKNEFEKMILKYVDETVELTKKALKEQEFVPDDISDILLVGGTTAIPIIQKRLKQEFPTCNLRSDIEPMECVAQGAGIMAIKLKGIECPNPECKEINNENDIECKKCKTSLAAANIKSDMGYYDVTSMHLGIRAVKQNNLDAFVPIIAKGSSYPLKEPMRQVFYTTEENQKIIRVPVFEGLFELASQNEQQGLIEWALPENLAKNTPVEVALNLDISRTITVSIRVMERDNLFHEVKLDRTSSIPFEEIPDKEIEDNNWKEELMDFVPGAEQFIDNFSKYTSPETIIKLKNEIGLLNEAIGENNEDKGNDAADNIYKIMIGGAGVASQLYLAYRTMDGASPEVGRELDAIVQEMREVYDTNDKGRINELTGNLKTTVARALQSRIQTKHVSDNIDFGQLLRKD